MKIDTVRRPYVLTFTDTGMSYPLTSDEAQRLLDEYPAIRATRNRVLLQGHGTTRTTITPATLGGGPAFLVTR